MPLDGGQMLLQESESLVGLWCCHLERLTVNHSVHDLLNQVQPSDIVRTSLSFSSTSAASLDGVHPKHFALGGEERAQAIALMLAVLETRAFIPSQLQFWVS